MPRIKIFEYGRVSCAVFIVFSTFLAHLLPIILFIFLSSLILLFAFKLFIYPYQISLLTFSGSLVSIAALLSHSFVIE